MKIETMIVEIEKVVNFNQLIGITFDKVEQENDLIRFRSSGKNFDFYHRQSCCENVYLGDICGDLSDLIGTQILSAYESSSNQDVQIWTFYTISTIKGSVTFRWVGESSSNYSEKAELYLLEKEVQQFGIYSEEELNLKKEKYEAYIKENPPWYLSGKYHREDGPAISFEPKF